MKQYDVILAGGLDFAVPDSFGILLGQTILARILEPEFRVHTVYFDRLNHSGELTYEADPEKTFQKLTDYLLRFEPKIIGFYTMANSFCSTVELAEHIHRKAPDVTIIFGGPHATVMARDCLRAFLWLKAVSRGESEKTILPQIRVLLNGGSLAEVPQITYRDGDDIVSTPDVPLLDAAELKQYSPVNCDLPCDKDTKITIEGGRGCPFSCSFCSTNSFWERKFRIQPVQDILDEIDAWHEKSGSVSFTINHDNFTVNRSFVLDFCRALKEKGAPYRWHCSSRVDLLDAELIDRMAEAGCDSIYLGIETGSARMQKLIRKNLELSHVLPVIDALTSHGMRVIASFIYGFADETEDDFDDTLRMIGQIYQKDGCCVQYHLLCLYPCTEETGKVYEQTFFDDRTDYGETALSNTVSPRGMELIRQYKPLFIQHYSFHTPIRDRFRNITFLVQLLNMCRENYSLTCKLLVKRHGLKKLFLENEAAICELGKCILSPIRDEKRQRSWVACLDRIVDAVGDDDTREIFRMEKDVVEYLSSEEDGLPFIREYALDIPAAVRDNVCIRRQGKYSFALDDRTVVLRELGENESPVRLNEVHYILS